MQIARKPLTFQKKYGIIKKYSDRYWHFKDIYFLFRNLPLAIFLCPQLYMSL